MTKPTEFPPQHQHQQPGIEAEMKPRPQSTARQYKAAGKLQGKVAVISGGDSGIGRAVALCFAKEGADVVILYLDEDRDAQETRQLVEAEGRQCVLFTGDIADAAFCRQVADSVRQRWQRLDILVNNAAEQHDQQRLEDISEEQWERTFRTNVFGMLQMTKAALPLMDKGSSIINTTSITAYKGSPHLMDYAATKGAIVAFTRSLALNVVARGIRVNGVAPGPIWTPLIPASFPAEQVSEFGTSTPMGRAGQPDEVAPAYVYLASEDSSYVTGQVIHVNGGYVING